MNTAVNETFTVSVDGVIVFGSKDFWVASCYLNEARHAAAQKTKDISRMPYFELNGAKQKRAIITAFSEEESCHHPKMSRFAGFLYCPDCSGK